jgi:methanethiol S-methyltransferase
MVGSAFAWTGAALFAASLVFFLYSYLVTFGRPAPPGDWITPAAVDTALFSAFALHHSLLARARVRARLQTIVPPHLERSLYTWSASLLFLGVCWFWRPVPGVAYALTGWGWWAGAAVQLTGIVVTHLGSSALDPLELAGVRQVSMAKTAPLPPRGPLLTTGAFAIVRHPIYLGWVLLVFGTPTMTFTRLVFAVVSTAYLVLAVPWEERSLIAAFGGEYLEYRRKVRWRMLPGIY